MWLRQLDMGVPKIRYESSLRQVGCEGKPIGTSSDDSYVNCGRPHDSSDTIDNLMLPAPDLVSKMVATPQ